MSLGREAMYFGKMSDEYGSLFSSFQNLPMGLKLKKRKFQSSPLAAESLILSPGFRILNFPGKNYVKKCLMLMVTSVFEGPVRTYPTSR